MRETETPVAEYMKIRRYVMTLLLRSGEKSVRIPTIVELAEKFGVSRPTVSKAMKALTTDGYIIGRPRLGSFTNPAKRMSRDILSLPIVSVLEGDGMIAHYTPYLAHRHAHLILALAKIPVTVHLLTLSSHREEYIIRDIESDAPDVLIWICPPAESLPVIEKLRENGRKVLLYEGSSDIPGNVQMDFFRAGYEIGKHLLAEGRRHLVYYPASDFFQRQLSGLRKAYREAGIALDERFFLKDMNSAEKNIRNMIAQGVRIDAFFSALTMEPSLLRVLKTESRQSGYDITTAFPVFSEQDAVSGYSYEYAFEESASALASMTENLIHRKTDSLDSVSVPLRIFKR